MPTPTPSAATSTRLTNLRFADDRASLEIDGQTVELTAQKAAPTLQAFQSFYQEAYRAYGTAPEAAKEPRQERTPWLQRLRGWLARWLGAEESKTAAPMRTLDSVPATKGPPASAPAAAAEGKEAAKSLRSPTAPSVGANQPKVPGPPMLISAFADDQGVHLLWNLTPDGAKDQLKERTYPFGSPVANRLQDCYTKLADLGYNVVDLKVWQPAPEAGAAPAVPAAKPKPEATKERTAVLLPPDSSHPDLIALQPVDGDLTPVSFQDSQKRASALHAAADPAQPADKRVTFVSFTIGAKDKPKLVRYATGSDPQQEDAWKPIDTLTAAAEPAAPKPAKAEPKAKTSPRGPDADFFPA
jgi:hypothetical protein